MAFQKDRQQADGGRRRNMIRVGPDLLTVPQIARMYSSAAIHVMTCIMLNRDPETVEIGSSDLEILAEGEKPLDNIPWKDRQRAAESVLSRGVGKPLDFETMKQIEKLEQSNTIEHSTEELEQIISRGDMDNVVEGSFTE
jgi:hypothetical protein